MIISRIIEEKNPKKGNVSRSRMKTSNTNNTQYQSSQQCAQRSRVLPQHQLQCKSVCLYVTGVILTIVGDWGNQLFPSVVLTAFVLSGPHHFANNKIDIFTIIILVQV